MSGAPAGPRSSPNQPSATLSVACDTVGRLAAIATADVTRRRFACTPRSQEHPMRVLVFEFMSLDGVVQGPGGPGEDTDGGFTHGGWSHGYFDAEVMAPVISESMDGLEALLFGRRTWQTMAAAWPDRA